MTFKPIKEAVAFYALDANGSFLCVKRSSDDVSLPGVWALPAASLREGETHQDAIKRAARDKLGVEVEILKCTGDDTQEKPQHILHLSEYEVKIVAGAPRPLHCDPTVSNYVAVQWSSDPEILRPAAEAGSSCSRVYLRNLGLWPDGNKT